jgi:hypothetical protein
MKLISFAILILIALTANAQQDKGQHIKEIKFEGFLFPKENVKDSDWMPLSNMKERYTPSREEIFKAEDILFKQLKEINTSLMNQGNGCPIIHKNLKKYKRQYFGYINDIGEKIIWINLVWNRDDNNKGLDEGVRFVLDGCSYFWNIKVNLNEEKLFDLIVNGSA